MFDSQLSIAIQIGDHVGQTNALSSLGRLHLAMGRPDEALEFLQQGLESAQASGKREDEAKIRHQVPIFLL
jgi:hypothetical protein